MTLIIFQKLYTNMKLLVEVQLKETIRKKMGIKNPPTLYIGNFQSDSDF